MGYCKFCGKELDNENRCNCAEFAAEEAQRPKKSKRGSKKISTTIKVLLAFVLVFGLTIGGISLFTAYKTPVEKLTKGIRKSSTELIMDSMYTESEAAEVRVRIKNSGQTWEDFIKDNDDKLKERLELDNIKRLKCDVVAKEKISGSNIDSIRNFYKKQFEADVKKAYRVEVEFRMKEMGEDVKRSGWLCVVKLKKGGWKFCPEYSTDHFDFIDNAIAGLA